jgi:hypothetical protein
MAQKFLNETPNRTTLADGDIVAVAEESLSQQELKNITVGDLKTVINDGFSIDPERVQERVTGLIDGGFVSANVNNVTVDITAGNGQIVDNYTDVNAPVITSVTWTQKTAVPLPSIATNVVYYIFIDGAGNVVVDTDPPAANEYRELIFLGTVTTDETQILDVINRPYVANQIQYTGIDALVAGQNVRISSGGNITPLPARSVIREEGVLFSAGINWHNDRVNPNTIPFAQENPMTFIVIDRNGVTVQPSGSTVFDCSVYDNAGTVTTIPNPGSNTVIHRVYTSGVGEIIQLGQQIYTSLDQALSRVLVDRGLQEVYLPLQRFGILLGYIIARKDALDFSDPLQAIVLSQGNNA